MISSVSYDTGSDTFTGFCPPMFDGLPSVNHFKTNSYRELEEWFEEFHRSKLININLIEPLLNKPGPVHSRPYILSAYGIDNQTNAVEVLKHWIYLYDECKSRDIRIVGFSTDADPRYLKAMKLALGFFIRAPNIILASQKDDFFDIHVPQSWNFFFMRSQQLFYCMQDGIHLVTKIRNRLLSTTANLSLGGMKISIDHLLALIRNHPKIDHNLVKSDIIPHDRQNFASCIKITSDDVLALLNTPETQATKLYLYLLKLVILTYVRSDTSVHDRLYFGWTIAFVYRMWW